MASPGVHSDGSGSVRGCVLAGGAGSRLGEPKANALVAGRPLISYPLEALDSAGLRPAVVAKSDTPLPELPGVEIWREPTDPRHPLCGIVEALRRVEGGAAVVCPCDLPLVPAELIGWLASLTEPIAVAASQPLLGRYSAGVAGALERALAERRSMTATVAALGARLLADAELERFGDPARMLANVNDREDAERVERLLTSP